MWVHISAPRKHKYKRSHQAFSACYKTRVTSKWDQHSPPHLHSPGLSTCDSPKDRENTFIQKPKTAHGGMVLSLQSQGPRHQTGVWLTLRRSNTLHSPLVFASEQNFSPKVDQSALILSGTDPVQRIPSPGKPQADLRNVRSYRRPTCHPHPPSVMLDQTERALNPQPMVESGNRISSSPSTELGPSPSPLPCPPPPPPPRPPVRMLKPPTATWLPVSGAPRLLLTAPSSSFC